MISVDGAEVSEFGMWIELAPGDYEVCFGTVIGFEAPGCQTATLRAGKTTTVIGTFSR
jgi:hypothetical protein